MPPRRTVPSLAPTAPSHPSDSAPTRRSRTRTQTTEATLEDDREHFDLTNVSGDDSDEDCQPARRSNTQDTNTTVQDSRVNDVSTPVNPKNVAADTRYFFEKCGDKVVCKECRQVFLHR